jgi:protein gp37
VKWNDEAARKGIRYRVFCGSMMDFLEDRRELIEPRRRAIRLIGRTPNLDWLILTKRPGNAPDGWRFGAILENVWFGVSVENQDRVDLLIPLLKATHPAVRFLSVEPLLEEIDLEPHLADGKIHWVIVGGESSQGKGKCRAFHLEWLESVITQCRRHNVPVFVKQLGSMPHADNRSLKLIDRKGGDMEEWPDWMRIREFPRVEQ